MVFYHYVSPKILEEKRNLLKSIQNKINCDLERTERYRKDLIKLRGIFRTQEREINITQERITNLEYSLNSVNRNLNEWNRQKEETVEFIKRSKILKIITVDDERNVFVSNGLISLNRDVLIKIIRLIKDIKKIRMILGVASNFFEWTKQPIFYWARSNGLLWIDVRFKHNPHGKISISGSDVIFHGYRTMYLDHDCSKGIFKMRIIFSGITLENPFIYFGCSFESNLVDAMNNTLYLHNRSVSCQMNKTRAHHICMNKKEVAEIPDRFKAREGLSVAVEVNSYMHTVHFFYGNILIPFVVSSIPTVAALGFSCTSPGFPVMVRVESLQKLPYPSFNPSIQCTPLKWHL